MYINCDNYRSDIKRLLTDDYKMLKNKTIFITGSSGLVGSCLIDTLMYLNLECSYNIKIYATFTSENSFDERFPSYKNNNLLFPVIQDITEKININSNIDYVIHCASNTHPYLYAKKPVETIAININGTQNILHLAKNCNAKKVISLSTLEVYGENKDIDKFKESDFGYIDFSQIRSCYPISKILSENLCYGYASEYGLNVSVARLGYIYGPTVKLNSSKADVQFLNKALNSENIVLKSAGLQKRSYCYVFDVVSALIKILFVGKPSEAYNIASTNGNVKLVDFANILSNIAEVDIVYEEQSEIEKVGGSKVVNSTLDSTKLEALGWSSKFTINEGIEHTYKIKKIVAKKKQ